MDEVYINTERRQDGAARKIDKKFFGQSYLMIALARGVGTLALNIKS